MICSVFDTLFSDPLTVLAHKNNNVIELGRKQVHRIKEKDRRQLRRIDEVLEQTTDKKGH